MNNTYLVVMAGGIGSRFWPFSRTQHPKQFHDVLGVGRSMLQLTVDRFRGICPPENVFVVTNRDYVNLVQSHLPDLPADQILGEPIGRNTAPCVAYASYRIAQRDPKATIIVSPADHAVLREEEFRRLIREAITAARQHDVLITLGIQPSRPDTGYGYIQYMDGAENRLEGNDLHKVKTFTEKPNSELARMFLESGDFLWNAGLFIWQAENILRAFHNLLSDVAEVFDEGADKLGTPDEAAFIDEAYARCRNISIDYGIMEKADNVYVLPADIGWSDLGTWDSLHRVGQRDIQNNVIDGDVMLYDTQDCIIKTPSERLVVVQGLEGYIVAEHDNVLLICQRSEEQRVKDFVADVKSKKGGGYH
ncbi:mannose-1-phosphate guanylyltransferase [Hymenobacter sp. BT559]|uniref:mannose-1-phosphate guanylyltransferase n=1 Tax=Hymenobacter sp. BT559 TaxID=2795729 RepID=UPI0018EBA07C|nr:mannose-1-phosphate guanylyltransferase [Hymenobacter sp. BT559]MBJ6143368.1 mannose-1-phosphate guanylyltransferase [Hymenobacter sp. BT559]